MGTHGWRLLYLRRCWGVARWAFLSPIQPSGVAATSYAILQDLGKTDIVLLTSSTSILNMANTQADSILGKHQLEKALHDEKQAISSGRMKDENPLDTSADFRRFCEACRRGDLRVAQEQISKGVNVNARDEFDYTPLILVSRPRSSCGGWRRGTDVLKP